MNNEIVLWLMQAAIAELAGQRPPATNAGPRFNDGIRTVTWEPEGFSRWMGWRGQEAQEEETAWPADELRQERQERHNRAFRKLREENTELRQFLVSLRDELNRRLGN